MAVDDSWKRIAPGYLTWEDVDPAQYPFDPARLIDRNARRSAGFAGAQQVE
jgi:hypothetical protein